MPFVNFEAARKILFITLPYILSRKEAKNSKIRSFEAFPYGMLSVASHIKNKSVKPVNIKVLDCNLYSHDEYVDTIKNIMNEFNPDLIGLSMMFDTSYRYLENI